VAWVWYVWSQLSVYTHRHRDSVITALLLTEMLSANVFMRSVSKYPLNSSLISHEARKAEIVGRKILLRLFSDDLLLVITATQPRLFGAVASTSGIVYQRKSIFGPDPNHLGQRRGDLVEFERLVVDKRQRVETDI